jgi:hypothetical protein
VFILQFVLKILPCYTVGFEPDPEPHGNFYLEPEPHKNDAAPQHWNQLFFFGKMLCNFIPISGSTFSEKLDPDLHFSKRLDPDPSKR